MTMSATHSSQPTPTSTSSHAVVVRPGFSSPAEEFQSVFNRGGSSLQRAVYHRGRSYSAGRSTAPYTARGTSAASSSTSNQRPSDSSGRIIGSIRPARADRARSASVPSRTLGRASDTFKTKEVVLLPSNTETDVIRGQRKADLMQRGFIRSELELKKSWTDEEVIGFLDNCFEDQLQSIPKEPGKQRLGKLPFKGQLGSCSMQGKFKTFFVLKGTENMGGRA